MAAMKKLMAQFPHMRLRPHAKAHKCAEMAQLQIAAGAVGAWRTDACGPLHALQSWVRAGGRTRRALTRHACLPDGHLLPEVARGRGHGARRRH